MQSVNGPGSAAGDSANGRPHRWQGARHRFVDEPLDGQRRIGEQLFGAPVGMAARSEIAMRQLDGVLEPGEPRVVGEYQISAIRLLEEGEEDGTCAQCVFEGEFAQRSGA